MYYDEPSPNGTVGRDSSGRFTRDNPGGPGNPYARRVSDFRNVLLEAVSDDDLYDIARTLFERGKAGDVMACRELLDRLMGKAKATLAIENEPERTEEEIHAKLRVLLERNPDLTEEIAEIGGVHLLSGEVGGTPQNPDAVVE
jgi:hypothetical protein